MFSGQWYPVIGRCGFGTDPPIRCRGPAVGPVHGLLGGGSVDWGGGPFCVGRGSGSPSEQRGSGPQGGCTGSILSMGGFTWYGGGLPSRPSTLDLDLDSIRQRW